jgi:hypothetical protein
LQQNLINQQLNRQLTQQQINANRPPSMLESALEIGGTLAGQYSESEINAFMQKLFGNNARTVASPTGYTMGARSLPSDAPSARQSPAANSRPRVNLGVINPSDISASNGSWWDNWFKSRASRLGITQVGRVN